MHLWRGLSMLVPPGSSSLFAHSHLGSSHLPGQCSASCSSSEPPSRTFSERQRWTSMKNPLFLPSLKMLAINKRPQWMLNEKSLSRWQKVVWFSAATVIWWNNMAFTVTELYVPQCEPVYNKVNMANPTPAKSQHVSSVLVSVLVGHRPCRAASVAAFTIVADEFNLRCAQHICPVTGR